jgi:hypothetical protein
MKLILQVDGSALREVARKDETTGSVRKFLHLTAGENER